MRTYLLSGSRVPNKDVAGPAYSSTQLPSTVLWSATLEYSYRKKKPRIHFIDRLRLSRESHIYREKHSLRPHKSLHHSAMRHHHAVFHPTGKSRIHEILKFLANDFSLYPRVGLVSGTKRVS